MPPTFEQAMNNWKAQIEAQGTTPYARQLAKNCAERLGLWASYMENGLFHNLPDFMKNEAYPIVRMWEDTFRAIHLDLSKALANKEAA